MENDRLGDGSSLEGFRGNTFVVSYLSAVVVAAAALLRRPLVTFSFLDVQNHCMSLVVCVAKQT